jgi:hypothetical protein
LIEKGSQFFRRIPSSISECPPEWDRFEIDWTDLDLKHRRGWQ